MIAKTQILYCMYAAIFYRMISDGATIAYYSFFFTVTTTTDIYTLSLHDALPIFANPLSRSSRTCFPSRRYSRRAWLQCYDGWRSEEHTSELQSRPHLVCRLLLEKKKMIGL